MASIRHRRAARPWAAPSAVAGMLCGVLVAGCVPNVPRGTAAVARGRLGPSVVLVPDADAPEVALEVSVASGSAWDPVGREGLAAVTARAVAAGAATPLDVVIGKDAVTFRMRCASAEVARCARSLTDAVARPPFSPDVVGGLVADAVVALGAGAGEQPDRLAQQVLEQWLFEGRPYGHAEEGRGGVVGLIDASQVRDFWRDRYLREATVVGLGGPVRDDDVAALVAGLRDLSSAPFAVAPLRRPPTFAGRHALLVEVGDAGRPPAADLVDAAVDGGEVTEEVPGAAPTHTVALRLGHPLDVDPDDLDWAALQVAFAAFGGPGYDGASLVASVVHARALATSATAHAAPFRAAAHGAEATIGVAQRQGLVHVALSGVPVGEAAFTVKLVLRALERLREDGLDEASYAETVAWLRAQPASADVGRRVAVAVEARQTGRPDPAAVVVAALDTLTRDRVNAALYRHLDPTRLRVVIVGSGLDGVARGLQGDAPIVEGGTTRVGDDAAIAAAPAGFAPEGVRTVEAAIVLR